MAVTPSLALILALDFSGSMDQKIEGKVKSDQLKAQARAVLSTVAPEAAVRTVIFGANPARGCQDVATTKSTSSAAWKTVAATRPGAFGRTPLASVLRSFRDGIAQMRSGAIILITDGADSCGQDPCAALRELDRAIPANATPPQLIIIGYDLKNEAKNLECLKNPGTKKIKTKFVSAGRPSEIQNALADALSQGGGDGDGDNENRDADDAAKNGTKSGPGSSSKTGNDGDGSNADGKSPKSGADTGAGRGPGRVFVGGAEATDHFQIQAKDGSAPRDWFGGLPTDLPPGEYEIRYLNDNGKTVSIRIGADEKKDFVLADFFAKPTADLHLDESGLSFEATPSPRTLRVHRNLQPRKVRAAPAAAAVTVEALPLGSWTLKVISPPWLKDRLPEATVVSSLEARNINLPTALTQAFRWIENDAPSRKRVIEITRPDGRVETHFVPEGAKRLPIFKEDRIKWLN